MTEHKSTISTLEHYYKYIYSIDLSNEDDFVFFSGIHDYMSIIIKQFLKHSVLYEFWHEKADEWYPVLEKIKNNPSLPEEEKRKKIDTQSEFYFLASFNVLHTVHDKVEEYKETGDESVLNSMSSWIPRIQRSLQKVHPIIISILETEPEKTEENSHNPTLVISNTKGIYQKDVPDNTYPIKRDTKRHRLVQLLLEKDIVGLNDFEKELQQDRILIQKEIREINTLFREKVQVPYDLIIHNDTGGFSLNKNAFVIRKEV